MAKWHNGYQVWLTEGQALENAQLAANRLLKKKWDKKAICGVLGNMRHESSLNPNMYEFGYGWGADRGFGLVQWTPRSKYWNWAVSKGYKESALRNGEAQMDRIDYEASQGIQWISTYNYPESFAAFRSNKNNRSVDYLTQAFTWNYERPLASAGQGSMPERQAFARKCLDKLNWEGTGGDDDGGDEPSKPGDGNGGNPGGAIDILKKAFEKFLDSIEDAMTWDMHSIGAEKYFSNSFFAMQKTFNNTYRLQMNVKLIEDMRDLINSVDTGSNGENTGNTDDKDDNTGGGDGKSVKPNGKNATLIGGSWTYANLPKKYKDAIKTPLFKGTHLGQSPFVNTGDMGQCTELTWAYMWEIWGKQQPAWDTQITNGQRVWEVYKAKGAKLTHSPTVGYAFSSKPPYIQASLPGIGHTGVVVAVFDDGSFLTANYNVAPNWAPSRVLLYSLINGVPKDGGNNFWFFSGIK